MSSMTAFTDELLKISSTKQVADLLKAYGKPAALVGSGALAMHLGKKEVDKYLLGRQVYDQMQARGE